LRPLVPKLPIVTVPHPVADLIASRQDKDGTVLVAGQFEPVWNLLLLVAHGSALCHLGLKPVIAGRGWPSDSPGGKSTASFCPKTNSTPV
jgi:hypothetical protein